MNYIILDSLFKRLNDSTGLFTIIALILTVWSLTIARKALNLKCGNKVIGYYNVEQCICSSTPYVSELILQNLKDKDVAIHYIYIRFGRNIFVDMFNKGINDCFMQILPPLGTLHFKFGPAYMYKCDMNTVDLSELLMGRTKGTIVLSTNQGRITVKPINSGWSPEFEYFKNYGTKPIYLSKLYTSSSVYSDGGLQNKAIDFSSYGDNVKYVVTLKVTGHNIEYPILNETACQVHKFEKLQFTKKCLQTSQNLHDFLEDEKIKGNIQYDGIVHILNFGEIIENTTPKITKNASFDLRAEGWFEYNVIDKFQTMFWNLKEDYKYCKKTDKFWNYHYRIFRLYILFKRKF